MQRIIIISVLLTAVSSSDLSCLKTMEDKFNNYKTQLTELKTSILNEKRKEIGIDQRGGPLDIFSNVGKLPGQLANILGNGGITSITNNLNQMLTQINVADGVLQNIMSTLANVVVLPASKRHAQQELVKSFLADLAETLTGVKVVFKVVVDILDMATPKEPAV